jgi:1-phosphofructokinase
MKVATVTLNPAIDQTIEVDNFQLNSVNRAKATRLDAGGKGVNVASFLAEYGVQVAVTGLLGEENAGIFERHFAKRKIEDRFVRVPGETRVNIKITDEVNQVTTDVNVAGKAPGKYELNRLIDHVEALSEACDWVVLSGNLPPGVPSDFYGELIQSIKKKCAVVLDTSGDALRDGLKAGPRVVKPNVDELSQLLGMSLKNIDEIFDVARSLLNVETQVAVVSMGEEGALFVSEGEAFQLVPPSVKVKSTVGAGDALVAGFVAGLAQSLSLMECAQLGTAFSLCAITQAGRDLPVLEKVAEFREQVVVNSLVTKQP